MSSLKEYFLLDPDIVFLNHGSYGAAPKPVFEAYRNWQLRLERQPVLFLGRELPELMHASRTALGEYLNADPDDLVYIPNATHGINIVARSLDLKPGDEVLNTDHEYGACDYTWEFNCSRAGALYIHQPIPLPVQTEEEIVEIQALRTEYGSFKGWLDAHHPQTLENWVKLFRRTFVFTGGEIVNEFLMSTGYLPGAHSADCPIYDVVLAKRPPWHSQSLPQSIEG